MKLARLSVRGLGPFSSASVDLESLPPDARVVAVCGRNGAGKSTLLEMLPGALYRETPTRGSLTDLATVRTASLEAVVENGARWTIRHSVDAVTGKSEALVLDAHNRSVLADTKVRSFDAWAKQHLPAREVLFSSAFLAQGAGGFLDAKPADRKAILLRVLGIDRIESIASAARERAREARAEAAIASSRVCDARAHADVTGAETACAAARSAAAGATGALEAARALEERRRESQENEARRRELEAHVDRAKGELADVRVRIKNNQELLGHAPEVRSAVERRAAIAPALARLEAEGATAQAETRLAEERARAAASRIEDCDRRDRVAKERAKRASDRLADRDAILAAASRLPELRERGAGAKRNAEASRAAIERLQNTALATADTRITALRSGLVRITRGSDVDPAVVAHGTLCEDDDAVDAARSAPTRLEKARAADARARALLEHARQELAATEMRATLQSDLARAEEDVAAAQRDEAMASQERGEAMVEQARCVREAARTQHALDVAVTQSKELRAEDARLERLALRAEVLAGAEARLEELRTRETAATERLVAAERARDAAPPAHPVSPGPRPLAAYERDATAAAASLAVANAALERARAGRARLEELERELGRAEEHTADWTRLADDLGRDGLQALEIDAAAPELSALANDLLHTCVGDRWTVRVETTRLSADSKRMIEGCDVFVCDTERGRDASAATLSGGERTIVAEAIALALSMLAQRRAGVTGATLIRDETGAALDPVAGCAYVAMLRRAADIVHASRVLFVSHDAALAELADARIVVRDGQATIETN